MVLLAHVLRALQVRLKAVCNEEHFTLEVQTLFHRNSPTIAVGSLINTRWFPLRMRYI
jgi:hypothetical protein